MSQVPHCQEYEIFHNDPAPKNITVCAKFKLKKLLPFEDIFQFKKTKLNDCGEELSGRWYIEFYAWDVQENKLMRKRFYKVNNIASK
jgi:hypothetical protein